MARRRRVTRREMKQDRFILFLYEAGAFIVQYTREIVIAVLLVAVSALLGYWYSSSRQTWLENAARAIAPARTAMQQERYAEAIPVFERVRKEYGGSPAAAEAALGLADAYFRTGKPDEAKTLYQAYLDEYEGDDEILTISARAGIAACEEQKKNYEEAARQYRQLAERYPDSFLAPRFLIDAGRCYQAADQTAQAKDMYDRVVTAYADSRFVQDAKTALAAL